MVCQLLPWVIISKEGIFSFLLRILSNKFAYLQFIRSLDECQIGSRKKKNNIELNIEIDA